MVLPKDSILTMEPKSSLDLIIEEYKKNVDITLIQENLKLSYTERIQKLQNMLRTYEELKKAKKVKDFD